MFSHSNADGTRSRTRRTRRGKPSYSIPDRDRTLDKIVKVDLGPHQTRPDQRRSMTRARLITPIRYAFRSFDRQWIVPDHRLLSQARSKLWEGHSETQVY